MAEGFLRQYQGDRFEVGSAGTIPKDEVHPLAVQVMNEVGIDIGNHRPKPLDNYLGRQPVRHLPIVCDKSNGSCLRIWPGAITRDYMPFDDPAEAKSSEQEVLNLFRRVRDEIGEAMRTWTPTIERTGSR